MRRTVLSLLCLSLSGLGALGACGPEASPDEGAGVGAARRALGRCPGKEGEEGCVLGKAEDKYSADTNRCVPNVVAQFDALKDHGEILGFWDGGDEVDYPSLDATDQHWQGVQRLAYPPGHNLLMVLTSSHEEGGHYAVAGMGSRVLGGFTQRRLGASRTTEDTQDWNVAPRYNDTIIQGGLTADATRYTHPSSMQALGQFVAIPLERIGNSDDHGTLGRTQLFDAGGDIDFDVKQCGDGGQGCLLKSQWVFEHSTWGAGQAALAKLDDGRYLMITGVTADTDLLEINVSGVRADGTPRTIDDPEVFGAWNSPGNGGEPSALIDTGSIDGWKDYQALQLVTECGSGQLFLIGTGQASGNADWADLYQVNLRETGDKNAEGEPRFDEGSPATTFTRVAEKHFFCTYEGSERQCDFLAAAGVFVDEAGTLLLYATVHDDSGPKEGVTRFVEFAPNDPVDRPDTPAVEACDDESKMWVELSDKPLSGALPPAGSDRFFIEYWNSLRSNKSFATAYDFNDEARSIRYCLPPGYRYKLCEHTSFGGKCQFFCGSAADGCSGPASGGHIQGVSFTKADASSGCFTAAGSTECI
jgi:hypothetical protein